MKKNLIVLSGIGATLAPIFAFAQTTPLNGPICGAVAQNTLEWVVCKVGQIMNFVVPVLVTLGVIYFIFGVITYVIASDEEAKKAGRDRIIFGVIGFVAIVGLWGLVYIVRNTFNVNGGQGNMGLPCIANTPGC